MREFFNSPRRILGMVFLALALGMVVLGETVLKERLSPLGYIVYWLICGGFTLLSACVALVDLVRVKAESKQEHRDLIEKTLDPPGDNNKPSDDQKH